MADEEKSPKSEVESGKSEVKLKAESRKRKAAAKPEALTPMPEAESNSAFGIPHSEINKSEIENPKSEISEMEVHHHPDLHHAKKAWKEYFLEFLMIFLAVTMGFFAENLREHISDNNHGKELAKTLYNELSTDSATAAQILEIRLAQEKDLDYLHAYFKDSSLTVLPRGFYPAFTGSLYLVNSATFDPKDGILSQLKNSGGMHYIKSVALQKLLGDLDVAINDIRYRNDQEYQFFAAPIKPFMLKYYDFSWLDQVRTAMPSKSNLPALLSAYRKSALNIKGSILNVNTFDRAEAANLVLFRKQMSVSSRSLQLNNYIAINHKILEVLRNSYTLQNE